MIEEQALFRCRITVDVRDQGVCGTDDPENHGTVLGWI